MDPSIATPVFPLFSLKGKTAIVSGAGGGLGLAIVYAFAEAGANVAILYHTNKVAIHNAKVVEDKYKIKCKRHESTSNW